MKYEIKLNKDHINQAIAQAKSKGITQKTIYWQEHLQEIALFSYGVTGSALHLYYLNQKSKNILFNQFNNLLI